MFPVAPEVPMAEVFPVSPLLPKRAEILGLTDPNSSVTGFVADISTSAGRETTSGSGFSAELRP